jgi:hypothetical protein
MYSNISTAKTIYKTNQYLSNLDLINKYNIKSKKIIPNLTKITLSFPLEAFSKMFFENNKNELDEEVQIKSLFLLYLLFSNLALITTKKQIKKIRVQKFHENRLSLKISLTKKKILDIFLYQLFFENEKKIAELQPFKNVANTDDKQECFIYNSNVLLQNFNELNFFLSNIYLPSNSKEFFLNLKFFFKAKKFQDFISTNLLKNISPFWVLSSKQ